MFYELLDQWTAHHKAAGELGSKMTEAFTNIAKGSTENPSLEILAMLEVTEESEKRLQEKMAETMSSIDRQYVRYRRCYRSFDCMRIVLNYISI